MSDIMPKIKMYMFISIIQLIINFVIGIFTYTSVTMPNYSWTITAGWTAFLPFASIGNMLLLGLDPNFLLLFGIFTGILTGIQTFIIVMMSLSIVSNLVWHPDV